MAFAIDNDAVAESICNGLKERATSFITPNFKDFYEGEGDGYVYNPEKAKELLEEAGFVDNDGDGFVEDPNGEPFVLQCAVRSTAPSAEVLGQYYIDAWKEIGINVELYSGSVMEVNAFYDEVRNDDTEIDVFLGGTGVGGDPNPYGMWNKSATVVHTTGFRTEKLDELLDNINTEFDEEKSLEAYKAWDEYMMDEVPQIPTLTSISITPVNKRIKNYSITSDNRVYWDEIELTAEEPISAE